MVVVAFILASYLFGSLPFVPYLAKRRRIDLRKVGSGNVGSGNLWQNAGAKIGMVGGLSDLSKGALPPLIARTIGLSPIIAALSGLAGITGQIWPIFLRFKGGKGNSAALGLALVLTPKGFLVSIIPMLLGGAVMSFPVMANRSLPLSQRVKFRRSYTNSVPLGMLTGFTLLPIVACRFRQPSYVTLACTTIPLLLSFKRIFAPRSGNVGSLPGNKRELISRLLYDRSPTEAFEEALPYSHS